MVGEDASFSRFALDSRDIQAGDVFLAIRGARADGHEFVPEVMAAGALAAVVERPAATRHILVDNLIAALGKLGRSLRDEFKGPVVGITGSNGKTTSKEMISAALSALGPVLKNVGNQNSEYTSPLTWANLTDEHRSAVIEMGMRGFHQIEHLAEVSQPTMGLITMIGTSHIEMVGTRQGIAEAKTELFRALPSDGIAHCWAEDEFAAYLKSQAPCRMRTFGFGPDAEMKVVGYRALSLDRCEVLVDLAGDQVKFELPTIGRHQALNAAAALLVATSAGIKLRDAVDALMTVELPPMRMEVIRRGGAEILLDTYNASPDSTVAALKTLGELPCSGRRIVVLGEMKELGVNSEVGHRQVGKQLGLTPFDLLILIGADTRYIEDEVVQSGTSADKISRAESVDDVREVLAGLREGDLALVKGSRALGLEKALEAAG